MNISCYNGQEGRPALVSYFLTELKGGAYNICNHVLLSYRIEGGGLLCETRQIRRWPSKHYIRQRMRWGEVSWRIYSLQCCYNLFGRDNAGFEKPLCVYRLPSIVVSCFWNSTTHAQLPNGVYLPILPGLAVTYIHTVAQQWFTCVHIYS